MRPSTTSRRLVPATGAIYKLLKKERHTKKSEYSHSHLSPNNCRPWCLVKCKIVNVLCTLELYLILLASLQTHEASKHK